MYSGLYFEKKLNFVTVEGNQHPISNSDHIHCDPLHVSIVLSYSPRKWNVITKNFMTDVQKYGVHSLNFVFLGKE